MISGARSDSVPGAQPEPATELEVLFGHQTFSLRRHGFRQVP
jgi:hypothetical protein